MRLNAVAAVLALCLASAAALAWLWGDAGRLHWSEPDALPPVLDEVDVAPASEPADVSRHRETLERPLFASSRRIAPRAPQGAEGREAVDPLKDVRLLGTYGAGRRGGVIISRAGKVERLPVGASIGEWKVAGEDGRGAALVRTNGERRRLELALNSSAPAVPATVGKASEPAAGKASAEDTARASGSTPPRAAQAATPRPAQPAAGGDAGAAGTDDAFAAQRRARLERLNARRAQKGLPPLNPQN
jgi:hypothetical protein